MMARKTIKTGLRSIKPGTPEMEAYLGAGYGGMTVEKAEAIIKERTANPALYPYEVYEQAKAFLEAYRATPKVIDPVPGCYGSPVAEDND
ncbi:MAG TPA: hypothetical protein PLF72_08660 [Anaerolineaceae bacterium]|nr:hypothetical protein [Anaerolineaceae bacterium]